MIDRLGQKVILVHHAVSTIFLGQIKRLIGAFDHPAQPARLALEMIAQRQTVQMLEGIQGGVTDRVLRDLGEQRLPQFLEEHRAQPHRAVGDDQSDRNGEGRLLARDVERIDRLLGAAAVDANMA